jgi:competence protein ComEA
VTGVQTCALPISIIDGRPYAKPEDIMKVKGIKQGEYNKIKDIITVR